jgi:hypothetical protein
MLEVKSSQLNENTGHWRMVVHSTETKCDISLIETEDSITTYTNCPKKITDEKIIDRLENIKERHLDKHDGLNIFDPIADEIDELIELIKDRPHRDTKNLIGFPVGIPKMADCNDAGSDK